MLGTLEVKAPCMNLVTQTLKGMQLEPGSLNIGYLDPLGYKPHVLEPHANRKRTFLES